MKKIVNILILVVVLFGCSEDNKVGVIEYGNITGKVVEKEGFAVIENAKVILSPSNNTTFTDKNGAFEFKNIEARNYSVQAIKDGFLNKFEAASLVKNTTVNVVLEMDISTSNNRPPTIPELKTPQDEATDTDNKLTLQWNSTDSDKDSLVYTVKVRNDFDSQEILIKDYKETTYELKDLKFGGKYFWQIGVSDGINKEVFSEIRSFTVKKDPGNRYYYVKEVAGRNVIYSSGFNSEDQEAVNVYQLTSSEENSWRPRRNNIAKRVAFLRTFNNQTHLYTMNLYGKDERKITASVPVAGFNLNEVDFSWSSDGSKLIYPYFNRLYKINNDGSGLEKIYETPDNSLISEVDWSYDGTKIAIKTNNALGYNSSIYIINTDGKVIKQIIQNSKGALGGINFSVSGDKLLFTKDISEFQSDSYRQLDTRIFLVELNSGITKDISSTFKKPGTNDLDPRFSPDESEIIFVNTSNDGISPRSVWKTSILTNDVNRIRLFKDSYMPDWE